jgi:uncharacterized membrane protein YtjA (UPF0391 family)
MGRRCRWANNAITASAPSLADANLIPAAANFSQEITMLHYAVVFLVVALIAAIFGFGGIAAGAVEIAKILFFIFAIMAVVTFIVGLVRKG